MKAILCNPVLNLDNGISSLYVIPKVRPSEVDVVAYSFLFNWLCHYKHAYVAQLVPLLQFTQLKIVTGFIQIQYLAPKTVRGNIRKQLTF